MPDPLVLSAANKEVAVARVSWLKYVHLVHFSKPPSERQLYRLVKRRRVSRIVEVGIGDVARSVALVRVAQRYAADGNVAYTGIDWFDARSDALPKLTLKQAHAQLQATGARIRLVPGEPGRSLASVSNAHPRTGLMLISAAVGDSNLAAAWFYVPRMLDDHSTVLRERAGGADGPEFEPLCGEQIAVFAEQPPGRRAA